MGSKSPDRYAFNDNILLRNATTYFFTWKLKCHLFPPCTPSMNNICSFITAFGSLKGMILIRDAKKQKFRLYKNI